MKITTFLLNIPWTFLGFFIALISLPQNFKFNHQNLVIVAKVKWLWLSSFLIGRKVRGLTLGNVIMLSNAAIDKTLNHEMTHIKQFQRFPLIFPLLYCLDFAKNGYQANKFEIETLGFD
ncbi:MAG: hypothetical protein AAB787_00795 [Patescibacteria group bacterium]